MLIPVRKQSPPDCTLYWSVYEPDKGWSEQEPLPHDQAAPRTLPWRSSTATCTASTDEPYHSQNHKKHGMNVQVIARPDGTPLWFSRATPGRTTT